jgi:hypothetical protein
MQEGDKVKIGDEEFEVLSVYTRKQAIEDGVLVDISQVAPDLVASAGITLHVAMTSEVWGQCVQVPEGVVGQDWKGRLWDILSLPLRGEENKRRHPLLHGERPKQ